jgi:hypothetical protein
VRAAQRLGGDRVEGPAADGVKVEIREARGDRGEVGRRDDSPF